MAIPVFKSTSRVQTGPRSAHGSGPAEERWSGLLRVLTYHRVAEFSDRPDLDPRLISATPTVFDQQMRALTHYAKVVSLNDVLEAFIGGKRLPDQAVLITFDDAYCDFTDYAWPILKRHELPVTIFIPTAYPDRPEKSLWWDRLHRAFLSSGDVLASSPIGTLSLKTDEERRHNLRSIQKYLKTMPHTQAMAAVDEICDELNVEPTGRKSILGWEELRHLASEGVTLGAHTQTHPLLSKMPAEDARLEIVGSCRDLATEIGEVLPVFCYPDGDYNKTVIRILRQENCALAFTTVHGQNDLDVADPLRLQRTNITRRITIPLFRLQLSPAGSYIDRWRRRKGRKHRYD